MKKTPSLRNKGTYKEEDLSRRISMTRMAREANEGLDSEIKELRKYESGDLSRSWLNSAEA